MAFVIRFTFFVASLAVIVLAGIVAPTASLADVRVKGYFRKDGTYVLPYYRSDPDGRPYNNYSYPGNTNPYTGEVAPGNSSTYLNNYYGSGGSGGSYYSPSYGGGYASNPDVDEWLSSHRGAPITTSDFSIAQQVAVGDTPPFGIGSISWMLGIQNRWPKWAVVDLQKYLNVLGFRTFDGKRLVPDGVYGLRTFSAHAAYFANQFSPSAYVPPPVTTTTLPPPPVAPDYPSFGEGWIVILNSKKDWDQAYAVTDQAFQAGEFVTVIDSSQWSSLKPGWWVAHTGPYGSKAEAVAAAGRLKGVGLEDAYVRYLSD